MSIGAALALTAVEGLVLQSLVTAAPQRMIVWTAPDGDGQDQTNEIIPQVVPEERHSDVLMITRHPVEQGAAITDHAYKEPATVMIRAGWSNSSAEALGNPNLAQSVYEALLALQESRQLFTIITGKRIYDSMLVQSLNTTTTGATENALIIECVCQQVIIVATQVTQAPAIGKQTLPQETQPPTNRGTVQVVPGSNFNPGNSITPGA